jgi:hypothetical protein
MVEDGENGWRLRLSKSVLSQNVSSCDISQIETDIEDPSSDNVHDMEKNNISKYRSNQTVENGVIVVVISAINVSSLCLLSSLVPSFLSCFLFISS